MTKQSWLQKVHENKDILTVFVGGYYPSKHPSFDKVQITAPAAEQACRVIRKQIAEETVENPVVTFERAIKEADVGSIYNHLNSAWFGVPESTSCWQIRGFKEAVQLLEDPVEYDGPEE